MFSLFSSLLNKKNCDRCGERKDRSALHTMPQKQLFTDGYIDRRYCQECYQLEQRFEEEYAREIGAIINDMFKQDIKPCHVCGNRNCLC